MLNAIPILSPQDKMQKELNATMRNIDADRRRPTAKQARTEKTRELMISNGNSRVVYVRINASTPYTRSSKS